MREAHIIYKGEKAGNLIQTDDGKFVFEYDKSWLIDDSKPAISRTLAKRQKSFTSPHLFPFFFNMLPEGANKEIVCKYNRIDEDDYFGILLMTAGGDTIGAVRVQKIES